MSLDAELLKALNDKANRPLITGILRGIEKESLRVKPDGTLSQTPHPESLGAALTHPQITTDFSESLLEFITAPSHRLDEVMSQLEKQHRYTAQQLNNEVLWGSSMPCIVPEDEQIPVALFGKSNVGRMKTYYRNGLGHRYGRAMQTIAGIHYNFSFPSAFWAMLHQQEKSTADLQQYKTERYFDLIRNFRRYLWVLLYLFGASPAVCQSFINGRETNLKKSADGHSFYAPYATSLRMGDLGYQSNAQKSLVVCYNGLDSYLETLTTAIKTPYPGYQDIPLQDAAGDYQQLNASLLQIENEFYSTIRPKRTARSGETALGALHHRGVEYVEVRCLDLNPYLPLGLDEEQIHFIDTFLLYSLLKDSPAATLEEYQGVQENQELTVYRGRDPELELNSRTGKRNIRDWGKQLLEEMRPVAELLDQANKTEGYSQSLNVQLSKFEDAGLTPSAKILKSMADNKQSFHQTALAEAQRHHQQFTANPLSGIDLDYYETLASSSLTEQNKIEAQPQEDFSEYLAKFYQQYQECCEQ